jgi:hypothetical protein
LPQAFEHLDSQFWLGLQVHRFWDTSGSTPIRIIIPIDGKIAFAINEAMALSRHIREKDTYLAILSSTCGSALLQANTRRVLPLFGKARFIKSQNHGFLAQLFKRVGTQVIAHAISLPDSAPEQALHSIGARFSRMFSQLPPVFAPRLASRSLSDMPTLGDAALVGQSVGRDAYADVKGSLPNEKHRQRLS